MRLCFRVEVHMIGLFRVPYLIPNARCLVNGWLLLAAVVLFVLGGLGIGGPGKMEVDGIGSFTGPAAFVLGLGALVLGIILPPF